MSAFLFKIIEIKSSSTPTLWYTKLYTLSLLEIMII